MSHSPIVSEQIVRWAIFFTIEWRYIIIYNCNTNKNKNNYYGMVEFEGSRCIRRHIMINGVHHKFKLCKTNKKIFSENDKFGTETLPNKIQPVYHENRIHYIIKLLSLPCTYFWILFAVHAIILLDHQSLATNFYNPALKSITSI